MDENKELLNEEVISDTDTENNEQVTENTDEAVTAEEDTQQAEGENQADEATAKEKSNVIMKPIVIAAGIVICAALVALVIRLFFNSSIEGTWHYVREVMVPATDASADEPYETINVDYFFDFDKDNVVSATIGTVTSKGTYQVSKNEEGKSVITMDLPDLITGYNFLPYSEYELSVSGNAFTGRRITMAAQAEDESEPSVFEFQSSKYIAPEITREGEFKLNKDIVGTWVYNQDNCNIVYEFSEDGTAFYQEQMSQVNMYTGSIVNIDYSLNGLYTVGDDMITVSYYYTDDTTMNISYVLDGDTLYVNGYPFTKQTAATQD